ncbi:site-specific integrase [Corynebacterium sp. P5848]|uniref:tyrosine-type recombinase/integrase n=1 Tax=Corynebacterium marambiense TaxID=2765364 RepID=UPI002260D974|nr:site-specific integrase [Corynebacterium marambiense]MCX7542332.1 site-specific integrase [Corynebacterium marambiense]
MASIKPYKTKKGTRWRVQYRDRRQISRTKSGFLTKAAAQDFAADTRISMSVGTWIDPRAASRQVRDLWDGSLDAARQQLGESSLLAVETAWRVHVEPEWGRVPVGDIDAYDVQRWVNDLSKRRGATVVHRAHGLLRQLLDDALRFHMITANPCTSTRLPARSPSKMATITRGQLDLLIAETKRFASLIAFLGYTGARWGEAVALTVGDIDVHGKRARIHRSASTVGGKVLIGPVKSRQQRSIAIPSTALDLLIEEMRGKLPGALIWTSQTGAILTTPSRRSWWHSAVDACRTVDPSFPSITPHDLRHAAASILVSNGASVLVVQRQLGHSSAKMTLDRYAHLFDADLDELLEAMERVDAASRENESAADVVDLSSIPRK